jgi:hypothetical protein
LALGAADDGEGFLFIFMEDEDVLQEIADWLGGAAETADVQELRASVCAVEVAVAKAYVYPVS